MKVIQYLIKLPTARAALLAFVGALLVFLRQTGIAVPDGLEANVKIAIDTGLSFLTLLGSLSVMHRAQAPIKKTDGTTIVSLIFALMLVGCTPAARKGIPVLSTVDAVGMGIADVMGWCEDAGANATTLARAQRAYADKDYRQAVALLTDVATSLRKQGADLPDSAFAVLKMAEGALAADAIQNGLRAISVPQTSDAGTP